MSKEKSIVEDALIQMKNLEEAVAENAKGILASTMKEEIKELVKESLSEEDDEIETEVDIENPEDDSEKMDSETEDDSEEMDSETEDDSEEMDSETEDDSEEMDSETEDDITMGMDMDTDNLDVDTDIETIDLTGKSDEDVLKVFKLMRPEDEIVVTKDETGNIHFKNEENEYLIVSESEEDMESEEEMDESYEEDESMEEMDESDKEDLNDIMNQVFEEDDMESEEDDMESEGVMYEIVLDDDDNNIEESKMKIKPKGMNIGSPSKFKYRSKPNMEKGFNEKMKEGPKTMGTGKPKFTFKDGENAGSKMSKNKIVKPGKKEETKEASRTYGNGSKSGRGLRKGITPNRNLTFESTNSREIQILKEKNEEYRKALNLFRNKLNEVAVFNSNLAYATRLFTEHSTSKQEKINILRRFDSVESIKESKMLYKTIKDELSKDNSKSSLTESVERKIENTASSGSASNLIESKTYENPQFLRMKDLMDKLTK
jgi:hypothetical protein